MSLALADQYVKHQFEIHPDHRSTYMFREKYAHTKRVLGWAKRLLQTERADADVLLYAAIFHDVGYTVSHADHPKHSAKICEKYLLENGFSEAFTKRVTESILNHDDKELLNDPTQAKKQFC